MILHSPANFGTAILQIGQTGMDGFVPSHELANQHETQPFDPCQTS
jgi:hypothetical protein